MKQLPKIPKQSCYYIDLKKTDNAHAYIPQKNYFVKKKNNFWELLDSPIQVQVSESTGEEKQEVERGRECDHLVFHRKQKPKKKTCKSNKNNVKKVWNLNLTNKVNTKET